MTSTIQQHDEQDENVKPELGSVKEGSLHESLSSFAEGDLTSCASPSTSDSRASTWSGLGGPPSEATEYDDDSDWEVPDLEVDSFGVDGEDCMGDAPSSSDGSGVSESSRRSVTPTPPLMMQEEEPATATIEPEATQDPAPAGSEERPRVIVALSPATKLWFASVARRLSEGRRQVAKSVDYTFTVKVKPTLSTLGDDVSSAFTKVKLRLSATSSKLSLAMFRRFREPGEYDTDDDEDLEAGPAEAESRLQGEEAAVPPVAGEVAPVETARERRRRKLALVRSGLSAWWKRTRAEIKAAVKPPPPPPPPPATSTATTTTTTTTSSAPEAVAAAPMVAAVEPAAPPLPARMHPLHLDEEHDEEVDNASPSSQMSVSQFSAYSGSTQEWSEGAETASTVSSPQGTDIPEDSDSDSDSEDYDDVDVEEIVDEELGESPVEVSAWSPEAGEELPEDADASWTEASAGSGAEDDEDDWQLL